MMDLLLRRRQMMMAGKPYDAELEFLEATGTQYIMTDIIPQRGMTFDTKVAATFTGNVVYWGVRQSGNVFTYNSQCYLNSNQNDNAYKQIRLFSTRIDNANNWNSGIVPTIGVMYELTGMTVVSSLSTSFSRKITLFAFNNVGNINAAAGACRIGLWRVYKDGDIVADFIPVRVGTVGYMYDKATGVLYGNAGSGAFVLGPDV